MPHSTPLIATIVVGLALTFVFGVLAHSLLPIDDWRAVGLTLERRVTSVLADGTEIERDVSECYIDLPQDRTTPVILGEPGDEALLGVVTLEILGFVRHPFNRTLQPARMLLA